MRNAEQESPSLPMSRAGSLREKMPGVTAWIDSLREALGKDMVDKMIRTGLKKGTFWAVENGSVVGRPPADVLAKHFAELASPKSQPSPVSEAVQPEPWIDRRWVS